VLLVVIILTGVVGPCSISIFFELFLDLEIHIEPFFSGLGDTGIVKVDFYVELLDLIGVVDTLFAPNPCRGIYLKGDKLCSWCTGVTLLLILRFLTSDLDWFFEKETFFAVSYLVISFSSVLFYSISIEFSDKDSTEIFLNADLVNLF